MKLLWVCNMMPKALREQVCGADSGGGFWLDHVFGGLLERQELTIRVLCGYDGELLQGSLSERCSYATFQLGKRHGYQPHLEGWFAGQFRDFAPDAIHIWGTEFGHTLAALRGAKETGLLDHTVVSIQGLCSVYTDHYAEGLPVPVQRSATFRDLLRQDNILQQRQKFAIRGRMEVEALQLAHHVIGRTDWDRACAEKINPHAQYHFCNETLRQPFYQDSWQYEACRKHSIFAPSCSYPVKGFHYLLEAFDQVLKVFPDARLYLPGESPVAESARARLRQSSYQRYLQKQMTQYGLKDKVHFLGGLDAGQMKENYLSANVFVLPSTIENSPNSLGEAMLLGVPCVASDVGGVKNLMTHDREGFIYQSTAPYMMAHYICRVFRMENQAQTLGAAAQTHARKTHDPDANLQALLEIYQNIAG